MTARPGSRLLRLSLLATLLVAFVPSCAWTGQQPVGAQPKPGNGGPAASPGAGPQQQACEPITEQMRSKFKMCFTKREGNGETQLWAANWQYTHSKYELLLDDKSQQPDAARRLDNAFSIYTALETVLVSGCSHEIVPVVCAIIFPPCTDSPKAHSSNAQPEALTKYYPCLDQCYAVKTRCECFIRNFAVEIGLPALALWQWPAQVNCARLPRNKPLGTSASSFTHSSLISPSLV